MKIQRLFLARLKKNVRVVIKIFTLDNFRVEGISDCGRCHAFENWKPEKFDHNKTEFNLDGAHKNIPCAKCHPQTEVNGNTFIKFKLEDFKCAACHKK